MKVNKAFVSCELIHKFGKGENHQPIQMAGESVF